MSLAIAKKKSTKQSAARSELKRRSLWCTQPIQWDLNLFLMKKLSFFQINLCDGKRSLFRLNGRGRSQPSFLQAERTWERSWVRVSADCRFGRFVLSASSETQGQLQSSSKILKHLPNVDLGITVVSVLQNTWGGRGHITVRTKLWGVKISRIFRKIQEKRYLFQRFVTSIVVGTILSSGLAAPGPPRMF